MAISVELYYLNKCVIIQKHIEKKNMLNNSVKNIELQFTTCYFERL